LDGGPTVDQMGTEVLLYEVGMTGMNAEEVEFASVGLVATEDRVVEIGAVFSGVVPVPHIEVTVLVLFP
jgi:hypothetical protein